MKINIKNQEKILSAIAHAERTCRARCITVSSIERAVARIEKNLSGMLHKKDWTGVRFDIDPNAQSFPSAYKGVPESTQAIIERFPSGWFVIGLTRDACTGTKIRPRSFDFKAAALITFASNSRNWN